ncbi:MAG: biotin synthase BioB [Planctomycetota bacterium]
MIVAPSKNFSLLAEKVVDGYEIDEKLAISILNTPSDQVLDLVAGAYQVRRHFFQNTVQLYFLMNAKSGLCPEDCTYCSQSKISKAPIEKYNLLDREKLMDGARLAQERNSKTYCIVISARGPNEREIKAVEEIVPEIKSQFDLKICACLGLLDEAQAKRLKDAGVDRVNHNLNTGSDHYENICSTHTYQDRIDTLNHVRNAGMEICSGGIIGMGESHEDIVDMAFHLRKLKAESIPLNFLNPIQGTPLEGTIGLTPLECLKTLAMFRFVNPDRELRIAGGREMHLRSLQPLGLYIANSMFVGDYLTTEGQPPESDYKMIQDLGFKITKHEQTAAGT